MKSKEKPLETKQKRLLLDISATLHTQIKQEALYRNETIKQYVLEAIVERMKRDSNYK